MTYPQSTALALSVFALSALFQPAISAEPLDEIVAVAGERVIMESELQQAVVRLRQRLGPDALSQMPPRDIVRSRVLDQLILTSLQTERAERAGLRVSDSELNDAVARLAEQNGLSVADFTQRIKSEGISPRDMRARMREEILVEKLRQREVVERVGVSSEDVDQYLQSESLRIQDDQEYHIRHLLIGISEGAPTEALRDAQDRVNALRERAVEGEDFGDLAIAHSDGQQALKGGDLGWLAGGFMPTLFSDVVPQLKPGEVSKVFRGSSGFHLIKLEGVRNAGQEEVTGPAMVKEVKAQHILLKLNEIRDNERAKEEIDRVAERLNAGDDFAELARAESDDTSTATQGGDMGWVVPRRYSPDFARQLQRLEIDEISQPFKTDDGWHILRVSERRERDQTEEQRRFRARQAIGQRKLEEESAIWLRRLRDEAYVEVRMPDYRGENINSGDNG